MHTCCYIFSQNLSFFSFGVSLSKFSFRFPTTYGAHTRPRVHLVGSLNPSWKKTGTEAASRGRYDCHTKFRTIRGQYIREGLVPRVHGHTGRVAPNALVLEEVKRILTFVMHYVEQSCYLAAFQDTRGMI